MNVVVRQSQKPSQLFCQKKKKKNHSEAAAPYPSESGSSVARKALLNYLSRGKVVHFSSWHCLQSVLSPIGKEKSLSESIQHKPDFSFVPAIYLDLEEVFRVLCFSFHGPYDCAIDLLTGASSPSSRLDNLSKPEQEAAGKIRPSFSHGSRVIFR